MPVKTAAADAVPSDQAGESAVTAVFGVGVFLAFLLLAAQVLVHLHTSSVVAAAAFDGATIAAGRDAAGLRGPDGSTPVAEQRVDQLLGRLDDRDRAAGREPLAWQLRARAGGVREVVLTIDVRSPSVVLGRFGLADVRRSAAVVVEE